MNIKIFKDKAYRHISELQDLIGDLPQKGSVLEECQRHCLLDALKKFEMVVNGVEQPDLDPE